MSRSRNSSGGSRGDDVVFSRRSILVAVGPFRQLADGWN